MPPTDRIMPLYLVHIVFKRNSLLVSVEERGSALTISLAIVLCICGLPLSTFFYPGHLFFSGARFFSSGTQMFDAFIPSHPINYPKPKRHVSSQSHISHFHPVCQFVSASEDSYPSIARRPTCYLPSAHRLLALWLQHQCTHQ